MMTAFAADFREGTDINLGVGYVSEEAMPREPLRLALDHVLANPGHHRNALNYGGAKGSPNLMASLRRFYLEQGIGRLTEQALQGRDMVIGPSGATSILQGLACIVKPGIVITGDPFYYIYCEYLERAGFEVIAVPEDNSGIRTERLEQKLQAIGERRRDVRFFYISTIGNPTGTILANARRRELLACAHRLSQDIGCKVPVLFDTAYEALVHDPSVEPPESALLSDRWGLAYEIGSLSKILAPALRVGYIIGPAGAVLDALVQFASDTGFSAPLITQELASHLLDTCAAAQLAAVRQDYRERAAAVRGWIEEHLGSMVSARTGGSAGFYFYLTFRDIETHEDSRFFRYLARATGDARIDGAGGALQPRVLYLPGQYCVSPRGELVDLARRQARISYGFESLPNIERGLRFMREAAEYAGTQRELVGDG
jgi:DNA-binding transcriptional MocR family regulator